MESGSSIDLEISRKLNLLEKVKKKTHFLFGSKGVGKSRLIAQQFSEYPIIDLLDSNIYANLLASPANLEQIIMAYPKHEIVVIDEVQKVPMLLDEVHRLIEKRGIKFLLTVGSMLKLRRTQANLLGGRARLARLYPFSYIELPKFNLDRYLQFGGLPQVYLGDEPQANLVDYLDTYLTDEVQRETSIRNLSKFINFLNYAALASGDMLNFTNIANDVGISPNTVREHYSILEESFLGFFVPAWTKTVKRKPISKAKFYFFDVGVRNVACKLLGFAAGESTYGKLFEHFIASELRSYISYNNKREELSYWQSKSGIEVDFIVGNEIAIEVKATKSAHSKHLKGLRKLEEEGICKQYILLSLDRVNRKVEEKFAVLYWEDFLIKLWAGEVF